MSVVDASVIVEYLIEDGPRGDVATERVKSEHFGLWAPHLIDAEVGQALRSMVTGGLLSAKGAKRALTVFNNLPLRRHQHETLLHPAWELRSNLTFYDALYVALAAQIDQPLLTFDARLAKSRRLPAKVELLDA